MLSEKVKKYLIDEGLYSPADDSEYQQALSDLLIDPSTPFGDFNLHTNVTTFNGRKSDLYNVCWFWIHSTYDSDIEGAQENLQLPKEYLPLDSFEGDGGFFYNRKTGEVLELEFGPTLTSFQNGTLAPREVLCSNCDQTFITGPDMEP